jgi:hypothetical protein
VTSRKTHHFAFFVLSALFAGASVFAQGIPVMDSSNLSQNIANTIAAVKNEKTTAATYAEVVATNINTAAANAALPGSFLNNQAARDIALAKQMKGALNENKEEHEKRTQQIQELQDFAARQGAAYTQAYLAQYLMKQNGVKGDGMRAGAGALVHLGRVQAGLDETQERRKAAIEAANSSVGVTQASQSTTAATAAVGASVDQLVMLEVLRQQREVYGARDVQEKNVAAAGVLNARYKNQYEQSKALARK